jgi:hypothetical protein
VEVPPSNRSWRAVAIFVGTTIVPFVITRYDDIIRDTLFYLPTPSAHDICASLDRLCVV